MSVECSPNAIRPGVAASRIGIALALCITISACSNTSLTNSPSSSTTAAQPAAALVGYVYDSRMQGLRPVLGSLGAAHLESPLAISGLRSAAPCSPRAFALASDAQGSIFTVALPAATETRIADSVSADQLVVLSPSCNNALVYSPSTGSGILITNLPASPRIQTIALSASGAITGAAISDTGVILSGVATSNSTTLIQVSSSSTKPATIQSLQKLGGLAFLPASDTAIIADAAENVVFLGKQLSESPSFAPIAVFAQGVSVPRAVAASADAHYAFVANSATRNILRIDLNSTAPPVPIACNCTATEFLPLAGNASYQLTDPAAGLIFALNGSGQTPHTVFVPTDNVSRTNGGGQ